jgi:hypothetical protein
VRWHTSIGHSLSKSLEYEIADLFRGYAMFLYYWSEAYSKGEDDRPAK